jgi:hypothetical protein
LSGRQAFPESTSSFTSIRRANGIELSLLGFPNESYTIETSTNLINWRFLHSTNAPPSTNALSNGFFIYIDSAVTNIPTRFYRAVNF